MADKYINATKALNNVKNFQTEGDDFAALLKILAEDLFNKLPAADVVSVGGIEQIRWERDVAIDQLKSYGIGFAEKKKDLVEVVRCKDCKHCVVREYDIIDELECEFFDVFTDPLDYCSKGERKADE